jgi:hypothetical protein
MHLAVSFAGIQKLYFLDQKLWMFDVFRRSLGRAGMCWSQPARVDHMCQKMRVEEFIYLFSQDEFGAPSSSRRATVSRRLALALQPAVTG